MAIKKADTENIVNKLIEKLEKGIIDTLNSSNYKDFLKLQSQFHQYSLNNQLLIYLQNPAATNVAGYKTWEKFERHVKKGEKGISILAPQQYKHIKEVDKVDPKTNQTIKDPLTGLVQKEKLEVIRLSFRKVTVFDVSQTDGKELPSICNELKGNSLNASKLIDAIKSISKTPIVEENILSGAKGYYSLTDDIIAIQKGLSLDQSSKTLVHEFAHSELHSTNEAKNIDRATKEVQAESVAYIVSNHFGVDTSDYSFDYIANWSKGKELNELKNSLSIIQKTSSSLIERIENVLNTELLLEKNPVKIRILLSESKHLQKGQLLDFNDASKILESLDQKRSELRKENLNYDYNSQAGETAPYVSLLKVKFRVELSDGQQAEARFDLGSSEFKSLAECIKKECYIDVFKYISETKQSIKEKVVDLYKNELPSIKHFSEEVCTVIDYLNKQKGSVLAINDIKAEYKLVGKRIDEFNIKEDIEDYKLLKSIVDEVKKSQLVEKNINAQETSKINQLSKSYELTL